MQDAPKPKRRRRFRFLPRFGMRAVLVLMVLVIAVIAPWANRTRQQIKTCQYFLTNRISFEIDQPLTWLRFLPQSWQRAGGGHWCCPIKQVTLTGDNGNGSEQELPALKTKLVQIGNLPRLHEINVESWPRIDNKTNLRELFAPLANINDLHALRLSSCGCIDHVLDCLPPLPTLTQLQLSADESLTDAGLEKLSKFPNLESLTFTSSFVVGSSLKTIASLPHLKQIIAPYSRFGRDDVKGFASHPALERFETSTVLNDDMLKVFSTCPRLKYIDATGTLVSDQGLSYLSNAKNLEEIRMDATSISDDGFAHFAQCKSLRSIYCGHCKLTDKIGQTLQQLPNVQYLDLRGTLVTKNLLPLLGNMKHLQELHVDPSIATLDDVLALVATAPQLQWGNYDEWCSIYTQFSPNVPAQKSPSTSLYLPHMQGLAARIHQAKNFGSVTQATLNDSDVNDQDISDLVKSNTQIAELRISHTATTLATLNTLSQLTRLTELEVGPFDDLSTAFDIIATYPAVTRLRVAGIAELSQPAIEALLKMTQLRSLTFDDLPYNEKFAEQICMVKTLDEIRWANKYWSVSHIEQMRTKVILNNPELKSKLSLLPLYRPREIIVSTEADLQSLKEGNFNYIDLSGRSISEHEIDLLNQVERCYRLSLNSTGLTDELFQSLKPLPELTSLDLSNNSITDAAVDHLCRFGNIRTLKLSNTEISGVGLALLLDSLRPDYLDVSGTKITEKAFDGSLLVPPVPAKSRKQPKSINLDRVAAMPQIVDYFGMSGLKNLPSEVILSSNVTLDANQLATLMRLRPPNTLTQLAISRDLLNVWSVADLLSGKKCLNKLELYSTAHVPEVLDAVAQQCPLLHTLVIAKETLDATMLKSLPNQIRSLTIRDCVIDSDVLNSIAQGCPNLLRLDLDTPVVGCSLQPLLGMSRLNALNVRPLDLSDEQVAVITQLKSTFSRSTSND